METRYSNLRRAIELLASSAEVQTLWLDEIFSDLTKGKSAEAYGNVELLLEFDDIAIARGHMIECGELKRSESDCVDKLDKLIDQMEKRDDDQFWEREALNSDPRWEEIRRCAKGVFANLPNENRESEWTQSNWDGGSSKAIPSKPD